MLVGGSSSPVVYRNFLMAGIFAQTVTFTTAGAGAGIADDMHKGVIDRFRSLPMARGAVLTGRTIADLVQTALTMLVLIIVALIVGWRIHNGIPKALAAFGLLLLLGYAFSWIGALIGLSVRTPEAATSGGLIWLFPVTFISIAFVDSRQMAGWLPADRRVEPVQRDGAGMPGALRQPRRFAVRRVADAASGLGFDPVVAGDSGGVPHARGAQIPVRDRLIRPSTRRWGRPPIGAVVPSDAFAARPR